MSGVFTGRRVRVPEWLKALAEDLTPGECAVLVGLVDGKLVSTIADEFEIAWSTAQTHAKAIYKKLGVSGQSGLQGLVIRQLTKRRAMRPAPPVVNVVTTSRQLVRMLHVPEPIGWECTVCQIRRMFSSKKAAIADRKEHVASPLHRKNNRRLTPRRRKKR